MSSDRFQVRSPGDTALREVEIPASVKALVVLNLQSYAGGRDLFGLHTTESSLQRRGYQLPIFNDGLLEVPPEPNINYWTGPSISSDQDLH